MPIAEQTASHIFVWWCSLRRTLIERSNCCTVAAIVVVPLIVHWTTMDQRPPTCYIRNVFHGHLYTKDAHVRHVRSFLPLVVLICGCSWRQDKEPLLLSTTKSMPPSEVVFPSGHGDHITSQCWCVQNLLHTRHAKSIDLHEDQPKKASSGPKYADCLLAKILPSNALTDTLRVRCRTEAW